MTWSPFTTAMSASLASWATRTLWGIKDLFNVLGGASILLPLKLCVGL